MVNMQHKGNVYLISAVIVREDRKAQEGIKRHQATGAERKEGQAENTRQRRERVEVREAKKVENNRRPATQ